MKEKKEKEGRLNREERGKRGGRRRRKRQKSGGERIKKRESKTLTTKITRRRRKSICTRMKGCLGAVLGQSSL